MRFPWYIGALGAALAWGVHYPLIEHALKKVSLMSVLLLTGIPVVVLAAFFYQDLVQDYHVLRSLGWLERLPIFAIGLTSVLGSVLLFMAIGNKNATLASLIEISYPVFVAIFAFVLFHQNTLNPSVVVGALLVFSGVSLIILNNP